MINAELYYLSLDSILKNKLFLSKHLLCLNLGINSPTNSQFVSGGPLPTARTVSLNVHVTVSDLSNQHSHLMMNFGQFVDHDITLSPESVGQGGAEIHRWEIIIFREQFNFEILYVVVKSF